MCGVSLIVNSSCIVFAFLLCWFKQKDIQSYKYQGLLSE